MLEDVEAIQEHFPAAEMERAMKIQEVILKAMAGKLKWWEAAEIIGVTDRTMRRWREKYAEHGYSGLWDHRKRSPSPKRGPVVLGNSDLADTVGVAHLPSIFTDSRVLGVVRNHAGRFSNSSGFAA